MTAVYPLIKQDDYTELKFSLRSLELYLKKPFQVVIIGSQLPDWITGVTWIVLGDIPGRKQLSIRRKILAALAYSDEIFMMNDDIFLLEETDPETYPYYSSGNLTMTPEGGAKPLLTQLQSKGKAIRHYDGHFPIVYRKHFLGASESFSYDCILKSMYCNFWDAPGVEISDCKILQAMNAAQVRSFIKGRPCFSTGIHSIDSALPILKELFPKPSKFELW